MKGNHLPRSGKIVYTKIQKVLIFISGSILTLIIGGGILLFLAQAFSNG